MTETVPEKAHGPRPHSGFGPPCGTSERLLVGFVGALHAFLRTTVAALGIFLGLEVTYFALIFLIFVFFAHITFLDSLVVSLVLGCVSRAEIFATAYDLLVWDQVVQTDQLIFRTLLPLSSTLPRICVLFFLRRTHVRPITTIHAMWFLFPISSVIRRLCAIPKDLLQRLLYS